ncbi:hypothetical protein [uncultured Sulfitobacter sp.]|uniref:hypothetical protein n=1 Tax=uncultured Sulfitobacter sp. TaxID=191468 RepID=UPI002597065B|nr:hypothetical protein [uncultured Sulfitobacter sp.]
MNALLISLAAEIGAPIIEKILSKKLGESTGGLVSNIIRAIADHAGASVDDLSDLARDEPELVKSAIAEVEAMAPEMIALYSQELEYQRTAMELDAKGPLWTWAWRPAGMWGLGVLWFWSVIVLHVANAYFKTALPQPPYDILMGLSALYLSLYMGGHTVKAVAGKWLGARK